MTGIFLLLAAAAFLAGRLYERTLACRHAVEGEIVNLYLGLADHRKRMDSLERRLVQLGEPTDTPYRGRVLECGAVDRMRRGEGT